MDLSGGSPTSWVSLSVDVDGRSGDGGSLSRSVFARRSGGGGSLSVGRRTAQSVVVVGLGRLS